jgi:hypothetical protein
MALGDELTVKLQHSGGEVELEHNWRQDSASSKGKQGAAKVYTAANVGTSNTRAAACGLRRGKLNEDQVVGMPASAQAALFRESRWCSPESVACGRQGRQALEGCAATDETENRRHLCPSYMQQAHIQWRLLHELT